MKTKFHPIHVWTTCSVLLVALIAALFLLPHHTDSQLKSARSESAHDARRETLARNFGQLPLSFEANRGQTAKNVDFVARGGGYAMFLSPTQATLSLKKSSAKTPTVVRMNLLGANAKARSKGTEKLPGKANYLLGNDRKQWRTGIETYRKVVYDEVYRGIDLIYYGQQRQLEYDFVVKPGASPQAIQLGFGGAKAVRVEQSGDLILHAHGGEVRWQRPVAYQEIKGARRLVDARYELGRVQDKAQGVSFVVGNYDKTRPLIIDPILLYSTYLGGTGNDGANAIAVNSSGDAYLAGETSSLDFPGAQGAASGATDAFVTKLNASGSQVLFSTYVGGAGNDRARGIALNFSNNIYLAGDTASSDFPTQDAAQSAFGGGATDGFDTSLNDTGTEFNYSTYVGGSGADSCNGVAIDFSGNASLIGQTVSPDFPTSNSALQSSYGGGNSDAFVTELDSSGAALYSTFLGGSDTDVGTAITIENTGAKIVTGVTASNNFPITSFSAFQSSLAGGTDTFLTRLDTSQSGLSGLIYSTYFGGSGDDRALALAGSSDFYLTGTTTSSDLPSTGTTFQDTNGGGTDAFIARFNPNTSSSSLPLFLFYATYLGGSGNDAGRGIAVDDSGNAYVTGDTTSTNFPTQNPLQAAHAADGGLRDAFASKLDSTGSVLNTSTYFGGNGDDSANALVLSSGDLYLAGITSSGDLPVTSGVAQPTKNAGTDAFVSKMSFGTSFVVINTNDAGAGSLRQAITDANGSPGTDTITFAIPGTGVQTITLLSNLPSIDDPVRVDGYTQPGSTPNTLANGTNAQLMIDIDGNRTQGLVVTALGSRFRGLVLRNFASNQGAVYFTDTGGTGANGQVSGCFIGTMANGTATGVPVGLAPGDGIEAYGVFIATNITIGGPNLADRNLISGNSRGINIRSSGNRVFNNLIGTQRDGETALPNLQHGVFVDTRSDNIIGNANFALGNVIAGNAWAMAF